MIDPDIRARSRAIAQRLRRLGLRTRLLAEAVDMVACFLARDGLDGTEHDEMLLIGLTPYKARWPKEFMPEPLAQFLECSENPAVTGQYDEKRRPKPEKKKPKLPTRTPGKKAQQRMKFREALYALRPYP